MTLSSQTSKNVFVGDGATVLFSYTFRIFADADLEVTIQDTSVSPQTEITLVLTSDYTVTGAGDASGGTITLLLTGQLSAAPSATDNITIKRALPLTQPTDYVENDPFPSTSHEDALDRSRMIDQQFQEVLDRSVKIPSNITGVSVDLPGPTALKTFRWNAAADALEETDDPAVSAVAAAASASAASSSASAAASSASAAAASASAASTSASNASTSETNAAASAAAAAASATSASATESVNQSSHGFSVGNWLYNNGTIYALADASAASTAEGLIGVVETVTDSDNFIIQLLGKVTGLSGLTKGAVHYLSEVVGQITITAPVTIGAIVKPVLVADSTTTGFVFNQRGIENAAAGNEVTAASTITDNAVIRGDGGSRGVQDSTMTISDNGEMVNTSQPAFSVTNSGAQNNISNSGSEITIVLNSETFDIGGNFASNTFTAPVTGKYQLSFFVTLQNIDSAASIYRITIVTSNRSYVYQLDPRQFAADIAGSYTMPPGSVLADMDAGDTATLAFTQDVGTAQTDIPNAGVRFTGILAS